MSEVMRQNSSFRYYTLSDWDANSICQDTVSILLREQSLPIFVDFKNIKLKMTKKPNSYVTVLILDCVTNEKCITTHSRPNRRETKISFRTAYAQMTRTQTARKMVSLSGDPSLTYKASS